MLEKHQFIYKNVPGRALIHMGQHLHLAEEHKSGTRHNLVIFCQNSKKIISDQA